MAQTQQNPLLIWVRLHGAVSRLLCNDNIMGSGHGCTNHSSCFCHEFMRLLARYGAYLLIYYLIHSSENINLHGSISPQSDVKVYVQVSKLRFALFEWSGRGAVRGAGASSPAGVTGAPQLQSSLDFHWSCIRWSVCRRECTAHRFRKKQ